MTAIYYLTRYLFFQPSDLGYVWTCALEQDGMLCLAQLPYGTVTFHCIATSKPETIKQQF
jgi:hypothetical protein